MLVLDCECFMFTICSCRIMRMGPAFKTNCRLMVQVFEPRFSVVSGR